VVVKERRTPRTRYRADGLEVTWEGAEVDAVYRAYLAAYGPRDGATRDAFEAAANRRSLVEWYDEADAGVAAEALEEAGMRRTANVIRAFALGMEADRIRERAFDLERQADELEASARR
jgi:hypothetical protein